MYLKRFEKTPRLENRLQINYKQKKTWTYGKVYVINKNIKLIKEP